MNDLEKRINDELDALMPKMSDELFNHPITKRETSFNKFNKKKIFIPLGGLSTILAALIIVFSFINLNQAKYDYYVVEINPKIILKANSDGNICEVKGGNSDADEILFLIGEELVNMDVNQGIEYISAKALEIGYFYLSNVNAMKLSSTNDDLSNLKESLADMFCNQGYYVAIATDIFDSKAFDFDKLNSFSYLNDIDDDNIQEVYFDNYYKENLKRILLDKIALINNLEKCMNKLDEIYNQIANNNMPILIKDYWYLKAYEGHMDDNLKNDMKCFEDYLFTYERLSGKRIENYFDIIESRTKMAFISRTLNSLLEDFDLINSDDFIEELNEIIAILENTVPNGVKYLDDFTYIPNDMNEYQKAMQSILRDNVNKKIEDYQEEFKSDKDKISRDDYHRFEQEIIDKYGSIEEFFGKYIQ